MSEQVIPALADVVERLTVFVQQDAEFRERLRVLAHSVLALTEPSAEAVGTGQPSAEPSTGGATSGQAVPPDPGAQEMVPPAVRPEHRQAVVSPQRYLAPPVSKPPVMVPPVTDADLPLIEERLRMKAEGSRWAAARRHRMDERVDFQIEIEPYDREIIEKAKNLPDCFLWMNHPTGPVPDLTQLDDLAGCFDAAADAVHLVRVVKDEHSDDRGMLEEALELLAEAQSALRAAVQGVGYTQDKDQQRVYRWLRDTCGQIQFFLQRYMRIEDTADPTAWSELSSRIERLDVQLDQARNRKRQYQSNLKRIRYHLKRAIENKAGTLQHDWEVILQTVDQMVQGGVAPSNTDIRELILPVVDVLPDMKLPQGFQLVLREIDKYLATRPVIPEETTVESTAEVKAVADLLRDKVMVLIGGVRRPQAYEALKRAFALKDVDWIGTREHESIAGFEPHIARPDVGVVMLAIRWSSHAFGDVRQFCDKYGKPLVRLPAGYNPNQVAMQVLLQCGERLRSGDSMDA
jgi:hypothetical protein